MDLGERLRAARQAAGFKSQQEFADRIGVARNSVTRIETNAMRPSVETLELWADACKVSVDSLLGRDGNLGTPEAAA